MDLVKEDGLVWTGFIWLRIGTSERGNEPRCSLNVGKFLSSCATGGFSRRTMLHGVSLARLMSSVLRLSASRES
jgi:hypothetical protein